MNAWSEEAVAVPTGGPEADWLPFSIVPTVGESPREEIISALFRSEYAGLLRWPTASPGTGAARRTS